MASLVADSASNDAFDSILLITLDLVDNVKGCAAAFFAAGLGTTKDVLEWFCLMMVTHPDIQDKLWQEVMGIIGTERPPNQLDRLKMPYTMAVFNEILRIACLLPINLPHM